MKTALKRGDRVISIRWSSGDGGVVVKPAPSYPLVRWDGRDKDQRARIEDIRLETADDVATRAHAQAIQGWRERRPDTKHARVVYARFGFNADEAGADVDRINTPEEMREAARELQLLADWFAERPRA